MFSNSIAVQHLAAIYAGYVPLLFLAQGLYGYFKLSPEYPVEYLRSTAWAMKGSLLGLLFFQSLVILFGHAYVSGLLRVPFLPWELMAGIACFTFLHLPRACRRQFARAVDETIYNEFAQLVCARGPGNLLVRCKGIERRLNQLYELYKDPIATGRRRPDLLRSDDGLEVRQKFYFLATYLGRDRLQKEMANPPIMAVLSNFDGEERRQKRGTKSDRVQPDPYANRSRVYDHITFAQTAGSSGMIPA